MSENNSLSSFDQLSTEILFDIFDYLSSNDIIYTFFHLNQRLNAIVLQHLRFLNYFVTPNNNFSIWQMILPTISSQIKCLTMTTTEFGLSLDLFPNLKSLIISSPVPIYYNELTFILYSEQLKKLTSFKVKSEIVSEKDTYDSPLFQKIFENDNSLHIFESFPELYSSFRNVNNPKMSVNLQSLSLRLTDFNCVFSLLNYSSNLKYLNLRLTALFFSPPSNPNVDFSHIKLKRLSIALQMIGFSQRSFPFLASFIKQFSSSLTYLSLNSNEINTIQFQFDGLTLQQQLLESMIQLKSFHLYALLNKEPVDVERFLSTFQTQFWIDHQWTVGTHETYLYTLPFHFDKLNDFIDFDQIKSSNSAVLNSAQTWSYVKSIDSSRSSNLSFNMIKQMRVKMPNLTSITFSFQLMNNLFTNVDETNETDITLDSITTVHCLARYLQTIKHRVIKMFPNTRHLMLSYRPQRATSSSDGIVVLEKFDEDFRSEWSTTDYIYSSKIQYIEIKVILTGTEWDVNWDANSLYPHVIHLVKELLNIFVNLQSFLFHFYYIPRFAPLAFTDLNRMIELLNLEKVSEEYHIEHKHNYLQFVKRNDK